MREQFVRTEMIFGAEAMEKLARSRVAVFGIGGVGGYVVEGLARSGVGALDLVDSDTVSLTNLNRQIIALNSTLGRDKVDAAAERVRDINPECTVRTRKMFYIPGKSDDFDFSAVDYVVDAIDTVTGKIGLILGAQAAGIRVISAMGAGNKIDPSAFRTADLYETSVCPLARIMRRELRRRGVERLKVVYSTEPPLTPVSAVSPEELGERRDLPGSAVFATAAAGMLIAAEVVKDLTGFMST